MKARQDIIWTYLSFDLILWREARRKRGKRIGVRSLQIETGIPKTVIERALDLWGFTGCSHRHFRALCKMMEKSPKRYYGPNLILPKTYAECEAWRRQQEEADAEEAGHYL